MNFLVWSKSSIEYGLRLAHSAIQGARKGQEAFLKQDSILSYVGELARRAVAPSFIGGLGGAIVGQLKNADHSSAKIAIGALCGSLIGLVCALSWGSRQLTASVASNAWQHVGMTRDERWLEKNPINYA